MDASLPCRVTCHALRQVSGALSRGAPPVITSVSTREALTALTVDDGPDPATTPAILEVLARHHARATFFLIGDRATAHPELVGAIVSAGHELGNHLWRDRPSVLLSRVAFKRELSAVSDLLRVHLHVDQRKHRDLSWFRPGSGFFTPRMLRDAAELGHRGVLGSPWLVATTYRGDPDRLGRRLGRRAHQGAVIVIHEGTPERMLVARVADTLLTTLGERSLRAVTVTELFTGSGESRAGLWKADAMTDQPLEQITGDENPRIEVLQAVVDRIVSWQEGSDHQTIRKELDDALAEADVEVDEDTRERIVERVSGETPHFDVREVLD